MLRRQTLEEFNISKIKSTKSAMEFISNINIDDIELFIYSDELYNVTDFSTIVGNYQVRVSRSCYDLTQCIKVRITNFVTLSGVSTETKLVSYIGDKLKTLFQTFEENVKFPNYKMTKRVLVTKVDQGYEITNESTEKNNVEHWTKFFSDTLMGGYISFGASVLLNRILISKGLPNNFSVISFSQNWEVSVATYKILDPMKLPINGTKVDVQGLEKSIASPTSYQSTWHMYFLSDGHLISKSQVGSPISMKVDSAPEIILRDTFLPKPTFNMIDLVWEDDLQLVSQFLDLKSEKIATYNKYIRNHPALKMLLKDFVQMLLIQKPKNTVNFAHNYFITFSTRANLTSSYLKYPQ